MLAIVLAALTVCATTIGGLVAVKSKDRFHLILGLAAGLLLGLVAFDLLPVVFSDATIMVNGKIALVSVAFLAGFLALHFLEESFAGHEPVESDYEHDHSHYGNIAGGLGAVAMAIHVFLDGLALGVAFHVSKKLGLAIFFALLVHAFSDGLNTVAMLKKTGHLTKAATYLLAVDAIARIGGAALGSSLHPSPAWLAIYFALFSGIIIYIATSHILPEAHSSHPSKVTIVTTLAGVAIMFGVVTVL
jgi:ZIP family zinc transporter